MKLYRLGIIWPNDLFLGRHGACGVKRRRRLLFMFLGCVLTLFKHGCLVPFGSFQSSMALPLAGCVSLHAANLSTTEFEVFYCVCWRLCNARSKFVFENHVMTPLHILECATRILVNYREVGEVSSDKSFLLVIAS
ncbi:LOW QUALITY PROTEIN: hypothetical protein PanWU01x14_364870 [Parasponia andersonii]|uniref:Uncharacterized protein n=1 Tax=Parasponia andersonii TaxID=3476 RepID=A0A2P5A651_PARAD|nr:LOW QUALITY PROTEIN: hypothetical protein PanWU01x14_364870 [Parasponia andersonii]